VLPCPSRAPSNFPIAVPPPSPRAVAILSIVATSAGGAFHADTCIAVPPWRGCASDRAATMSPVDARSARSSRQDDSARHRCRGDESFPEAPAPPAMGDPDAASSLAATTAATEMAGTDDRRVSPRWGAVVTIEEECTRFGTGRGEAPDAPVVAVVAEERPAPRADAMESTLRWAARGVAVVAVVVVGVSDSRGCGCGFA